MNQEKIGIFLKDLRKEKEMTQEHLAEKMNVNSRTISRWENAKTMPDFDILIELAKLYDVSIEEILNGERTATIMEKQTEETLYNIAEYENEAKKRNAMVVIIYSVCGIVAHVAYLIMNNIQMPNTSIMSFFRGAALDVVLASMILSIAYATGMLKKLYMFKKRREEKDKDKICS